LKKYLKFIVGLIVLSLISFLAFKIYSKLESKKAIEQNTKIIPAIQLKTIDNKVINLKSNAGKFHFLFFFNTECEHCQAEATLLQKHLVGFKEAEITFISIEPLQNIKAFANKYQLLNQPNITFCHIEPEVLAKQFVTLGFPTIFIYNPENELVKKYIGETKMEALTRPLTPSGGI
jgi:thiol-disulfide isomerase/thioredoxin